MEEKKKEKSMFPAILLMVVVFLFLLTLPGKIWGPQMREVQTENAKK